MFWKRCVWSKSSCLQQQPERKRLPHGGLKNPGFLTKTATSAAGNREEHGTSPACFLCGSLSFSTAWRLPVGWWRPLLLMSLAVENLPTPPGHPAIVWNPTQPFGPPRRICIQLSPQGGSCREGGAAGEMHSAAPALELSLHSRTSSQATPLAYHLFSSNQPSAGLLPLQDIPYPLMPLSKSPVDLLLRNPYSVCNL